MRLALLFAALVLVGGCFRPGGGHSGHTPPERLLAGEATILMMEFSVWGAGSGNLSKRYTEIVCHYRLSGHPEFQTVRARIVSSDKERMRAEFTIPPQTLLEASGTLEYYFEFLFDGYRSTRATNSVPIVSAPNNSRQPRPSSALRKGERAWLGLAAFNRSVIDHLLIPTLV